MLCQHRSNASMLEVADLYFCHTLFRFKTHARLNYPALRLKDYLIERLPCQVEHLTQETCFGYAKIQKKSYLYFGCLAITWLYHCNCTRVYNGQQYYRNKNHKRRTVRILFLVSVKLEVICITDVQGDNSFR